MQLTKIMATLALAVGFMSVAQAQVYDTDTDVRNSVNTTSLKRQVTYQCQSGKNLQVVYGFNQQKIPTYAEAFLNGKTRLMPYNMRLSDNVDTYFGDENNFGLSTSAMTLSSYHKNSISVVTSPSGEILFKGCNVRSIKKF